MSEKFVLLVIVITFACIIGYWDCKYRNNIMEFDEMNEKRFILKIETTGDYDIYDNLKHDYLVRDGRLPVNCYAINIINLLNNLNDENEQLKKQLSKYDKLKISIFNKYKGDWKWNDNNDIILNLRTGNKFYLRNSGAVESLVGLLNEQQATITKLEQICETKMQEIEDIKYGLKEIAYKYRKEVQFKADTDPNQAVKEVLGEQQATIEHLTKSRDKWRELSNSFSFYCKCYEKAIERAFEEKPYPTEDDINRIYAELEKELEE